MSRQPHQPGLRWIRASPRFTWRRRARQVVRAGAYTPAVVTNFLYFGDNLDIERQRIPNKNLEPLVGPGSSGFSNGQSEGKPAQRTYRSVAIHSANATLSAPSPGEGISEVSPR